jgi:hypothetical protein
MPSVTIDLADLETIVMTTGALKTIEGALAQRKQDPFVRQHLDFTAAHDRLASAMRNARRAEAGTLVAWDGELDEDEVNALRHIDSGKRVQISGHEKQNYHEYDGLSAKGCIVMGQPVVGVIWAGEERPALTPCQGFALKITDRGREKLAKIDAKPMTEEELLRGLEDMGYIPATTKGDTQ